MESKWLNEKESLETLIQVGKTYEEIGRAYGCSGSNIKKVAKRLGIQLTQRRKINSSETFNRKEHYCKNCGKEIQTGKYCCKQCEADFKHKEKYQDFLNNPEKYNRANYCPKSFKEDILKEQNGKCSICGMSPMWNGKKLVFILDHIDGHASNNSRNNLRMICPNCDSQLDTYKSKNKCGERSYYRYHKGSASQEID